jgi:hypothetical protein
MVKKIKCNTPGPSEKRTRLHKLMRAPARR